MGKTPTFPPLKHFRDTGAHELQPIEGTATGWRCWHCGYTEFGDEGQG